MRIFGLEPGGGVTGIAAMDIILGAGRRAGLVKLNLLG